MSHLKGWRPNRRIDGKGTPTNEERADMAMQAVNAYADVHGSSGDEGSDLQDCLADLLHFAASIGLDPHTITSTALTHFETER